MIIAVKAKPGSKRQEIEKVSDNEYIVCLKQRAEDNKANIELLNLLRRYFGRGVKIIKGLKSKNKVVEIAE